MSTRREGHRPPLRPPAAAAPPHLKLNARAAAPPLSFWPTKFIRDTEKLYLRCWWFEPRCTRGCRYLPQVVLTHNETVAKFVIECNRNNRDFWVRSSGGVPADRAPHRALPLHRSNHHWFRTCGVFVRSNALSTLSPLPPPQIWAVSRDLRSRAPSAFFENKNGFFRHVKDKSTVTAGHMVTALHTHLREAAGLASPTAESFDGGYGDVCNFFGRLATLVGVEPSLFWEGYDHEAKRLILRRRPPDGGGGGGGGGGWGGGGGSGGGAGTSGGGGGGGGNGGGGSDGGGSGGGGGGNGGGGGVVGAAPAANVLVTRFEDIATLTMATTLPDRWFGHGLHKLFPGFKLNRNAVHVSTTFEPRTPFTGVTYSDFKAASEGLELGADVEAYLASCDTSRFYAQTPT